MKKRVVSSRRLFTRACSGKDESEFILVGVKEARGPGAGKGMGTSHALMLQLCLEKAIAGLVMYGGSERGCRRVAESSRK